MDEPEPNTAPVVVESRLESYETDVPVTEPSQHAIPEPHDQAVPAKPRDWSKWLLGVIAILLGAVVVVEIVQVLHARDLEREVTALETDVTDLKPLLRDVDVLGEQIASLNDQVAAAVAAAASSASSAAQTSDGNLPEYDGSGNDLAVVGAMELPEITGPEYYSSKQVSYTPGSDDKARVWLIWAHWCPHCQNELPQLNTWWPENSTRFPNIELVTVTTAIDETRGNPLEPYLDTEQFSFPVIVDQSGEVAAKFGTTAFPFWVLTDTEGTVVFRMAGEIGIDSVDQLFTHLESMTTES